MIKKTVLVFFILVCSRAYADPISYWGTNTGAQLLDGTGNGNSLSMVGTVPLKTSAPAPYEGTASSGPFSSSNMYMFQPAAIGTGNFTGSVTVALMLPTSANSGNFFDIRNGAGNRYLIMEYTSGSSWLFLWTGTAGQTNSVAPAFSGVAFNDGLWHIIRFSANGATVTWTVDGVSVATGANGENVGDATNSHIGTRNDATFPNGGFEDAILIDSSPSPTYPPVFSNAATSDNRRRRN